jgi:hypothetical protein
LCLLPKTSEIRWGSPQELISQPLISSMTTPIGIGSDLVAQQHNKPPEGQKQAANTTLFAFIIFIVYLKSIMAVKWPQAW